MFKKHVTQSVACFDMTSEPALKHLSEVSTGALHCNKQPTDGSVQNCIMSEHRNTRK